MKQKTIKVFYAMGLVLKDKKFWAFLLFIIGTGGMLSGNDVLPAELQSELTLKIVYVIGGITNFIGLVLAAYGKVPFEATDKKNKGGNSNK